jgi:signal transduction histidine kinase
LEQSKRVDQVKSEFLSVASHQLRTPLSSIGWYAEMLADGEAGKVSKQQQEFLSEITVAQKRIARIINQLLHISQIELGRMKIRPVSMEVADIIDQVTQEYASYITKKQLNLSVSIGKNIGRLLLDEELFKIVLDEVLSNATKYTPEGGDIMLKVSRKQGGVAFIFTDSGVGVAEDQLEDIFSRFFRGDNVKAMDTDGTGVGLFLVKTIVERAGGQVEFSSRINKGSRMEIWLPKDGMIAR